MLVHLNGWPGSGKKTIGELLAQRLGARFFHNHLLYDLVESCCERSDAGWQPLYDRVRAAAYDALASRSCGEALVMTNAMASDELALWSQIVELAQRRGDLLVPVVLDLDPAENRLRLCDPARGGAKLKRVEVLDSLRSRHKLHVPESDETLVLDVSALSAEQVTDRIEAHMVGIAQRASEKAGPV